MSADRPDAHDLKRTWWSSESSSIFLHGWQDWHSSFFPLFLGESPTRGGNLHVHEGRCKQYTAPYALLHARNFSRTCDLAQAHQGSSLTLSPNKSFHCHLHATFTSLLTPARRRALPQRHPHDTPHQQGHHRQDTKTCTPQWEQHYDRLAANSPLTTKATNFSCPGFSPAATSSRKRPRRPRH